jgi:FkbM family methyltransferase
MPRYIHTSARFLGRELQIVDGESFLAMCQEIFVKRIYEFEAKKKDPYIIDCGANIGLSVIFLKTLYPAASIVAFEADPAIFRALTTNVRAFGCGNDVQLHNKAVWSTEATLTFHAEGASGGRLVKPGDTNSLISVPATRLKDYLDCRVDLLKLDVEGAETDILRDCAENLGAVEHIFVEYHSHSDEPQALHDLLAILQTAGFRYHIKEAATRPMPFVNKTTPVPGMDLQLDICAYRP